MSNSNDPKIPAHFSHQPPGPPADGTTMLVAQARQGKPHAWPALYRRFQAASVQFGKRQLGDEHLAQDAFHESIIEATENLGKLQHDEAFTFWFRRILIKQCDRISRKVGRSRPAPENSLETRAPVHSQPHVAAEIEELGQSLQSSVDALPEPERSYCRRFYFDNASYGQISQEMGVPMTTVRNRLARARRILRSKLAQWQGSQPTMLLRAA